MKTLIIFFVALLLGLALGWGFTIRQADHEVASVVEQMQAPIKANNQLAAVSGMLAISYLQAGDSNNALRVISRPLVDYYYFNAKLENNDERTKKLLALIEESARKYSFIADAITNRMQRK